LRLAKFNIDEDQSSSFTGLPTPATGILLASYPIVILVCLAENKGLYYDILTNPYFLAATAVIVSFLMVSSLPMFAFKFSSASWSENQTRYIFLILSVFLLIILKLAAIPLLITLYVLISIVNLLTEKK
jgi:CDP-diacylglycerol--serine O-phosphatidyltransferase